MVGTWGSKFKFHLHRVELPWMYRHQNLSGSWTTTIYYILPYWWPEMIHTCNPHAYIDILQPQQLDDHQQQSNKRKQKKYFDAVKTTMISEALKKETWIFTGCIGCSLRFWMQPAKCKKRHVESSQDVNTGKVADASLILVLKRGANNGRTNNSWKYITKNINGTKRLNITNSFSTVS